MTPTKYINALPMGTAFTFDHNPYDIYTLVDRGNENECKVLCIATHNNSHWEAIRYPIVENCNAYARGIPIRPTILCLHRSRCNTYQRPLTLRRNGSSLSRRMGQ